MRDEHMRDAFEQVLLRLRQGERYLRKADIRALSDLNRRQMQEFRQVWVELPADTRLSTISALAQISQDSFEYCFDRIFREALSDPVPQIRRKAVEGLWECEEESLASTFLHMLQEDPDTSVRSAVAVGLGRFVYLAEFEEIEPTLAAAIESALLTIIHNPEEPLELRRRAVESIGYSGNPEVQSVIRDAYEDDHPDMRMSAVIAMGRSADRRWGKIILQELMSEDRLMRQEAVRAAGELELQEATDLLARILDYEDDVEIRRDAVRALGKVGGKGAKTILEHIIASEDEDLFDVAQDAMEELTFGAQFPEINELLRLVEEDERRSAGRDDESDEWEDWDGEEEWEEGDDFLDEEAELDRW
ncbi:MAG: HEAT repeat domain-containing protein [Anaerolineae bacterium]